MIIIRPYKACDSAVIMSWLSEEQAFYLWSAGQKGTFPPSEDLLNQVQLEIAQDRCNYQFVADDEQGPVGYFLLQYSADGKMLHIDQLIVAEQYRGLGYGHNIIMQILHQAFDVLHMQRVTVGTFANNKTAYNCYRECGFTEVVSETPQSITINGEEWEYLTLETFSAEGKVREQVKDIPEKKAVEAILENNSFRYAFQPIVSASTGEIYGYEALMRSDLGSQISPLTILKYAKENDRLYDIEKATFFNVMNIVSKRLDRFGNSFVFINSLPAEQLKTDDYLQLKEQYGLLFRQVIIEITEDTELNPEQLENLMKRSKQDGFGIAIDDYGTGYSNIGNLLRYMPSCVKLDRLLISDINQDPKKQYFVKSLVDFAHENGFLALAEGVETSAEMRMVIQLGIDLIQGFYTGRPSFEIVSEVEPAIRNEILNIHVLDQSPTDRKIYVVDNENELPLMRLALEHNTGLLISKPEFKLVGNPDYVASMNIRIKDNTDCHLTIKDVFLESFQDMPCIELGENVHLTLHLEGQNSLRKVGICVPATSSLVVEGEGNLYINVKGIQSYGIGNLWDSLVGDVTLSATGFIDILLEADDAIAIGGGYFAGKKGIQLTSGKVRTILASRRAIGIGCAKGNCPISINDLDLHMELNVERGMGIGCREEESNVHIETTKLVIKGSGNQLCGIGSNERANGDISIDKSLVMISINGQIANLIGTKAGKVSIEITNTNLELRGEGGEIMGLGSRNMEASITCRETNCNVNIKSGEHLLFGAREENILFEAGLQNFSVNE